MARDTNKRNKTPKLARRQSQGREKAILAAPSPSISQHFSAALAVPVSKFAQVIAAVTLALEDDRNWPPNDRSASMGATYRYTVDSIRMFLVRVHNTLANGTPPHQFDPASIEPEKALGLTVDQLMAAIYEQAN